MSVVYKVERDGRSYALKRMADRLEGSVADISLQFRREAAAIARLQHPAVVDIIEVGEADGSPFLLMEFVEGEGLDRRLERGPLSEADTVALAITVTDALTEVHRLGLIHRDIKPSNIIVHPSGHPGDATVIDFGMVSETTDAEIIVGTARYAPPEQLGLIARNVGPSADLYALGSTLFECMTGHTPFEKGDSGALMHRIATQIAEPVSGLCTSGPGLCAVIQRLLSKDPDDRYPSAVALLADLERVAAGQEPLLDAERGGATMATRTPMVGRGNDLTALRTAWTRAASGQTTFASIVAPGGSGKTRLARELTGQIGADALVLSGKCQERERTPFGPLREMVDHLMLEVERASPENREILETQIRERTGEDAPMVGRLSAALRSLLGDSTEARSMEPGADQLRFLQAAAAFLRGLSRPGRPLVLLLDDLQWLDQGTLGVLAYLAEQPHAHVLVLSTCRPSEADVLQHFADATRERAVSDIELSPLNELEVGELIAAHLGGRALADDITRRLHALTQGNPFAVGEYLSALLDRGIIRPQGEGWVADFDAFDSVNLPSDVVDLIVARVDALDPSVRHLVQMAATYGARFDAPRLARFCAVEELEVAHGLQTMQRLGLIEQGWDGQWSFHHDRAREAILEPMDPEARRDAHQQIAEAILSQDDGARTDLYAAARHIGRGHVDRNRPLVSEVNLNSGHAALDEHAYEDAHAMLLLARQTTDDLDADRPRSGRLLTALGRAAAMTGRHTEAFEILEQARDYVTEASDQFNLQYLLTLTYASQGLNMKAHEVLQESFRVIGRPLPASTASQVIQLLWTWCSALLLRWTGWRGASATGEEQERRLVLSRLNYAGSMLALLEGDTLSTVDFVVRDLQNTHYLPPCGEKAIAQTVYGAVIGSLHLDRVMKHHTSAGVAMAEALGDPSAAAVCRSYEACGHKWVGDLDRGNELQVAALPLLNRYVPGSWYAAMMITDQSYSFLHAGRTTAARQLVIDNQAHIDRTNNKLFQQNNELVHYMERTLHGHAHEAAAIWTDLQPRYTDLQTVHARLGRSIAIFETMLDREELGPEFDTMVEEYMSSIGEDYYSFFPRMLLGYARLAQVERAQDEDERTRRMGQLRAATRGVRFRNPPPLFGCHVHIWTAAIDRLSGRHDKVEASFDKAAELLGKVHNPRGEFYLLVERAALATALEEPVAEFYATKALTLARTMGWHARAVRVERRFKLHVARDRSSYDGRRSSVMVRSAESARRYADALLEVSLASASTLDESAQATKALESVASVLGAERAVFYRVDGDRLELAASAGSGAESTSSTVVEQVLSTGEAVVLTADESGQNLSSKSILTQGLRSIMAAPLMLRERMIGVVYVDSRLAKGIFTEQDVELLLGLANHIAIAMETARAARLETARVAMERDLELVGTVQNLMLPAKAAFRAPGVQGQAWYQAAAQCGGDWWWQEVDADGALTLWLGDVSGHGAAPAMITSTVAATFHTVRRLQPELDVDGILAEISHRLASLCGTFHMTMTVLRIDPVTQIMTVWAAGGVPVMRLRDGRISLSHARGTVLGQVDTLEIGHEEIALQPGDRVFCGTDGSFELRGPNGREFGMRGMSRLLKESADKSLTDMGDHIMATLCEALDGEPADDDITWLLLAIGEAHNAAKNGPA